MVWIIDVEDTRRRMAVAQAAETQRINTGRAANKTQFDISFSHLTALRAEGITSAEQVPILTDTVFRALEHAIRDGLTNYELVEQLMGFLGIAGGNHVFLEKMFIHLVQACEHSQEKLWDHLAKLGSPLAQEILQLVGKPVGTLTAPAVADRTQYLQNLVPEAHGDNLTGLANSTVHFLTAAV